MVWLVGALAASVNVAAFTVTASAGEVDAAFDPSPL
jgi:hypothetical protein